MVSPGAPVREAGGPPLEASLVGVNFDPAIKIKKVNPVKTTITTIFINDRFNFMFLFLLELREDVGPNRVVEYSCRHRSC